MSVICLRDVAQPGSALAWGARGREFKSRRPDETVKQQSFQSSGIGGFFASCVFLKIHVLKRIDLMRIMTRYYKLRVEKRATGSTPG